MKRYEKKLRSCILLHKDVSVLMHEEAEKEGLSYSQWVEKAVIEKLWRDIGEGISKRIKDLNWRSLVRGVLHIPSIPASRKEIEG